MKRQKIINMPPRKLNALISRLRGCGSVLDFSTDITLTEVLLNELAQRWDRDASGNCLYWRIINERRPPRWAVEIRVEDARETWTLIEPVSKESLAHAVACAWLLWRKDYRDLPSVVWHMRDWRYRR